MFDIKKIDDAIEYIADNITKGIDKRPETITALAELIRARAELNKKKIDIGT